jgi:hypothetical protein
MALSPHLKYHASKRAENYVRSRLGMSPAKVRREGYQRTVARTRIGTVSRGRSTVIRLNNPIAGKEFTLKMGRLKVHAKAPGHKPPAKKPAQKVTHRFVQGVATRAPQRVNTVIVKPFAKVATKRVRRAVRTRRDSKGRYAGSY